MHGGKGVEACSATAETSAFPSATWERGKSSCPSHASHSTLQHLVMPLITRPERLQNPADAHRRDVSQAGLPRAFLLAPRLADELLQFRQLPPRRTAEAPFRSRQS